jgi:thioredoxin reductase
LTTVSEDGRPFPPGAYPLLLVGSGPGGLQLSYSLRHLGADHAVISADEGPGGMFRRWPLFQRMLSWSKPFAPADRRSRQYERYDWNSLLAEEEELRGIQPELMDGTSYFPSRHEMEQGLTAFTRRAGISVRYGCRWEATRAEGGGFTVVTSDGEYRAPVLVFAVGVAEPWRPSSPGLELVPHYAEMPEARTFAGKSVFILGKKNSAFEIATGLLPLAKRIVLASPSTAKTSVETHSLVGVRARYVQPFEDHALGGGVFIVDAKIDSVTRSPGGGYQVQTRFSVGGAEHTFEADEVIAATGFQTRLLDLPGLGVTTFGQSGLPAQTPYWESSLRSIYFAGTITQGAAGRNKHGVPPNSGAVHGHRYNARVLAEHLASKYFQIAPIREMYNGDDVVDLLLGELSGRRGADLFHQRSYLARVFRPNQNGWVDDGIQPLKPLLDDEGDDEALAATLEADDMGRLGAALYLRRKGAITERFLEPDTLLDFGTEDNRKAVRSAFKELVGAAVG